jgi:ABC-type polysaccharide/polyol phosphate export permease
MKTNIFAVLLLLLGALWTGQGYGIIEGSVMTGDSFWLYVGIVLMALGIGLLVYKQVKKGKVEEN